MLELPTSPPPDAATVKAAYRRLSLRWHPDKHRGDEARATSLFKTVAAAYATLTTTNFDFERWSTAFAIPPLQTLDDVLALAMSGCGEMLRSRSEPSDILLCRPVPTRLVSRSCCSDAASTGRTRGSAST